MVDIPVRSRGWAAVQFDTESARITSRLQSTGGLQQRELGEP